MVEKDGFNEDDGRADGPALSEGDILGTLECSPDGTDDGNNEGAEDD